VTFPASTAAGGGGGSTDAETRRNELNALFDEARAYLRQGDERPIDWRLEPLVPILDGRRALFVSASTESAIREAVAWADEQGVRMILSTGADAQQVAGLLAEREIPVVLSSVLSLPPREDLFHAYPYQAPGVLAKAGVRFAFSADGFQFARNLAFEAGRAIGWGLDPEAAIRALTLDAARILGIDRDVGSIETGKLANLIVVRGDPTEIRSRMLHVVIAGRDVSLAT
jgi:hypothetical protein